jgi:hypothetical protein
LICGTLGWQDEQKKRGEEKEGMRKNLQIPFKEEVGEDMPLCWWSASRGGGGQQSSTTHRGARIGGAIHQQVVLFSISSVVVARVGELDQEMRWWGSARKWS